MFDQPDYSRVSHPSVEDREAREFCPMCEALPTEPHGEACPLFLPLCACGRPAKRARVDGWTCGACGGYQPVGAA